VQRTAMPISFWSVIAAEMALASLFIHLCIHCAIGTY
jgi:hypothetical protein